MRAFKFLTVHGIIIAAVVALFRRRKEKKTYNDIIVGQ